MPVDLRKAIEGALRQFLTESCARAAKQLLATLGYSSDRSVPIANSKPEVFLDYVRSSSVNVQFNETRALFDDWVSADLLFQLTDDELSSTMPLFKETNVNTGLLRSYLFFAIELRGGDYARGKLTDVARQINRIFPMPVMVFIKHVADKKPVLSIAVINRRQNKRDATKDVLGKVTIIRNVAVAAPHRGHIEILNSVALKNLEHPERLIINNFDRLHEAWERIFNVELLNEQFYKELANWVFWASNHVGFPEDIEKDRNKRNATSLIRLLTRLIFCWFLKEKGELIPEKLFSDPDLKRILRNWTPLSDSSSSYYHAILQNLFFGTLNQPMGMDEHGQSYRDFARDQDFQKHRKTADEDTLYQYSDHFLDPEEAIGLFAKVPFLNGGLFECLDRTEEGNKKQYLDGFTHDINKRAHIPNRLFFAKDHRVDLSAAYGESKQKNERIRGILHILRGYKFTVEENTPIDQEIALDPELLGKVFENLLASFNEETKTTARKHTGSFYTPRVIVEYMVDEALKAHLTGVLVKGGMAERAARDGIDLLFAYTEERPRFSEHDIERLLAAIHACKILDPACGSGAFPMGVLQKLVYVIRRLDQDNERWKRLQIDKARAIPDPSSRKRAIAAIEDDFANNHPDYGRKLYLILNCLYGVDNQPIAIQITKLRFFISLVAEQKVDRKRENYGIRRLPNLETNFVAADALIALESERPLQMSLLGDVSADLQDVQNDYFLAETRQRKLGLQQRDGELRKKLLEHLRRSSAVARETHKELEEWNPYDPLQAAKFFEPVWMFGRSLDGGFDVVLGNPPYISVEQFAGTALQSQWRDTFSTYSARGDIYCFFYERFAKLLRPRGTLCFITSNKWMRAGYGEKLRSFLSSRVNTNSVLDFGMAQNFGTATTYTCILRFTAEPATDTVLTCYVTDARAAMSDPASYFAANAVQQKVAGEDPWVVLPKGRQRIKELVEPTGVPLGKWDIQISRGIITGYNEAFYLTAEQRETLIAEDPASEQLIVKLLRGRDVERYKLNWENTYQIIVKFGAYKYLESRYPAVYRHLQQFEKPLKARGQCQYGRERKVKDSSKPYLGQHHWLELDNNPTDEYLDSFKEPKIIYPEITKWLGFYLDEHEHYFPNNKAFVITSRGDSLAYLTAFFNSSLFRCSFRDNFPELMGNTYEVRKIFMDAISVKKPSLSQVAGFEHLVSLVQFAKRVEAKAPASFLEDLVDACVMECYFHQHMAERKLLFFDELASHLEKHDAKASESKRREFLEHLYRTLNAPKARVRNQLLRMAADSPDLLAVIMREGKV